MPVINPKTGKVMPRRAVRGCARLSKGFKQPKFKKAVSICLSVAQTGQRRGYTMIPKKAATSCSSKCPKADEKCLRPCFRRRLRVPRTRETKNELRRR